MVIFAPCVGFADQHGGDLFMIRRREFIAGLGGAAAWPLAARAQQPDRMRRVGVLVGLAEEDPETQGRLAAFRQGMQQRDWSEGRNLQIDYRCRAQTTVRVWRKRLELQAHSRLTIQDTCGLVVATGAV
jgi:putative tryptophan/tyrosine transport system substrate-binding protein